MKAISRRQRLVLLAPGILIVIMLTIFARFMVYHLLVIRANMDNEITQMFLYDNEDLRITSAEVSTDIAWEKEYPFTDTNTVQKVTLPTKIIESKVAAVKHKIGVWTESYLLGYRSVVETGRRFEVIAGWNLPNPKSMNVLIGDGIWSFYYPRYDVSQGAASITDLAQCVNEIGADFLYVQAPFKVDKYGDFPVNGCMDFTNQNCDDLLMQLQARGVATMDLRDVLYYWVQLEQTSYHDFFYRTDHHWKPETALRVAKVVGNRLEEYGIPVDDRYYTLKYFDIEVLPKYFLGSQGRRATLARAQAEDFSVLHPIFDTTIKLSVPAKNITDMGNFEILYDRSCIEKRDFYNKNPYAMYGYGDTAVMDIENMLLPPTDKKVLLIKDSFGDTLAPFLSLGIRNLMTLDVRHFTGSVKNYISKQKPDVVILMYTRAPDKSIDWSSHRDRYDFR